MTASRDGITFIYRHRVLRWVFLMMVVTALSVRSYNFLLPAYAVHVGHRCARARAMMASRGRRGVGALAVAAFNMRRRATMWIVGADAGHRRRRGARLLAGDRGGRAGPVPRERRDASFTGSSNILTQTLAPEEMRGRAMSVYTMVMLGLVPGGALICGSIAMLVDLRIVFVGAGVLACTVGLWVYLAHPRLRAA